MTPSKSQIVSRVAAVAVVPAILAGFYLGAYFYLPRRIPWMELRPERQITIEVDEDWQVKLFKPGAAVEAWLTGRTVEVYRSWPGMIEPF